MLLYINNMIIRFTNLRNFMPFKRC